MRDPIVAEIHRYREEHARRFNCDPDVTSENLKREKDPTKMYLTPSRFPQENVAQGASLHR